MSTKIALVTGGSSGIGEATALKLQELGYTTYAAARRVQRMQHLTDSGIRPLEMDVTNEASMQSAIRQILAEEGHIDVLVNNAGYGSFGALEDVPMSEARYQFEVNVFGATTLIQLILPHMRERRSGTIINVTSVGGKIYIPLGSWYHASKFALEAISDCLRLELQPFGINVVVVEPGGTRTEWGGIAEKKVRTVSGTGPYAPQANALATLLGTEATRNRLSSPELIANIIAQAASAQRPRTRYAVGFGVKALIFLHSILPNRWFDALLRWGSGMPA